MNSSKLNLNLRTSWPAGASFILLVFFATLSLYASTYTVILLTSIFMYIILTVSWVIFSGPTGYISFAPAANVVEFQYLKKEHNTIYYIMLTILVLLLLTTYLIRRSRFGLALRSIGESEEASAYLGVNVNLLKTITFSFSAVFMGATGAIMATRWTYVDPYIAFKLHYSFMPVLMSVFGGMGQLYGPVLGAGIFAILEELLITKFPYYYMFTIGLILLIVIVYLPNGLVGLIQKWQKRNPEEQHANP
ncbi:MAG: branched-chain amino acid ABC transporter permease [Anaerolineales bacterium]